MQVTVEVVRAEPAWNSLAAAQALAADPVSYQAIDLGLSRIVVDVPAAPSPSASPDPRPVSVVVQYLRN